MSSFEQQLDAQLSAARMQIAQTQQRMQAAQLTHRVPPPQPTTCCGRGCNGCVWEGWYQALNYWQTQANELLKDRIP